MASTSGVAGTASTSSAGGLRMPFFGGKRNDWGVFKVQLRRWCRLRGLDISDAGLSQMSKADDIMFGDYFFLSMKSKIDQEQLSIYEKGTEMFKAMRLKYEVLSIAEEAELREKLADVRLSGDMNIERYIAKKLGLITRLNEGGFTINEEMAAIELLRGLPSAYDNIREAVELMKPTDRSPEEVSRLLRIRYQIIQSSAVVEVANATAQAVRPSGRKSSGGRSKGGGGGRRQQQGSGNARRCYNCNKAGHLISRCPTIECYRCGRKGHTSRVCDQPDTRATADAQLVTVETLAPPVSAVGSRGVERALEDVEASGVRSSNDHVALANDDAAMTRDALRVLRNNGAWLVDSGTSSHMTPFKHSFTTYGRATGTVRVANKQLVPIVGRGEVTMLVPLLSGERLTLTFEALHVPDLDYNLFSMDKVVANGAWIVLRDHQPYMRLQTGQEVSLERWSPRTMLFPAEEANMTEQLWHERLGHVNKSDAKVIAGKLGVKLTCVTGAKCKPCLLGKAKKSPIPKVSAREIGRPLQLVTMDAAGPLPRSIDGHKHLLLYVDALGPLLWPYFTSRKSDFVETFRPFVASVGLPELLRSDGARELIHGRFLKLTQELRVKREQTTACHAERARYPIGRASTWLPWSHPTRRIAASKWSV